MSNFTQSYLEELKLKAAGAVDRPEVSERLEARYTQANDLYVELSDGDLRDWVTRKYRAWYNEWRNGERGPPCKCSDPGCPLKNGSLPYSVRRNESVFSGRHLPDTDERIKEFLDGHPEAVALSEPLDELREKRRRCEELFQLVYREANREISEAAEDNTADRRRETQA